MLSMSLLGALNVQCCARRGWVDGCWYSHLRSVVQLSSISAVSLASRVKSTLALGERGAIHTNAEKLVILDGLPCNEER